MLAAKLTVFVHFKLLFDLLLVALGIIRDIPAFRALQLGHVVFDASHSLPAIPYIYNVCSVRNFSVSVNTYLNLWHLSAFFLKKDSSYLHFILLKKRRSSAVLSVIS